MKNWLVLFFTVFLFGVVNSASAQNPREAADYIREQDSIFDAAKSIQDALQAGQTADDLKKQLDNLEKATAKLVRRSTPIVDPLNPPAQSKWPTWELGQIDPNILSQAVGEAFGKSKRSIFTKNFLTLMGLVIDIDFEAQESRGWVIYADTALNELLKNPKAFYPWFAPKSHLNLCGKINQRQRFGDIYSGQVVHCDPQSAYLYHYRSGQLNAALEWAKVRAAIAKRHPSDDTIGYDNAIPYMKALVDLLEMEIRVGTKARAVTVLEEAKRVTQTAFVDGGDHNRLNELEKQVVDWSGSDTTSQSIDELVDSFLQHTNDNIAESPSNGPAIVNRLLRLASANKLTEKQRRDFDRNLKQYRPDFLVRAFKRRELLQYQGCHAFVDAWQSRNFPPYPDTWQLQRELLASQRQNCPIIAQMTKAAAERYMNTSTVVGAFAFDEATLGEQNVALLETGVEVALLLRNLGYSGAAQLTRIDFWSCRDGCWTKDTEVEVAPSVLELMLHSAVDFYSQSQFDSTFNVLTHINHLAERWMTSNWIRNSQELSGDHKIVRSLLRQSLQYWMLLSAQREALKGKPIFAEAFRAAQLSQLGDVSLSIQAGLKQSITADWKTSVLVEDLEARERDLNHYKAVLSQMGNAVLKDGFELAVSKAQAELEATRIEAAEFVPIVEQYSEIAPVRIEDIQKRLKRAEAFLFLVPVGNGTAAFFTTSNQSAFYSIGLTADQINAAVSDLRKGLDPNSVAQGTHDFDPIKAHNLYLHLFGPLANVVGSVKHFLMVAEGGLASLPFQVLLKSKPSKTVLAPSDYRRLDWFAKHHAVTTLTSPRNLLTQSDERPSGQPKQPLIGFGDPIFNQNGGALENPSGQLRAARPDQLLPLPETRDELKNVAKITRARDGDLFFGAAATESNVKSLSASNKLKDYSVLYFATHGTLPGELDGFVEPGLVLTQPAQKSSEDDGYLSASEISSLKLNADWVVLSACNTAAAGQVGASSLSGLAKAFFKAGARSLLVSHWEVISDAAVALTVKTFQALESHETKSRAEALRLAMVRVMQDETEPFSGHPAYWAPFAIVGE